MNWLINELINQLMDQLINSLMNWLSPLPFKISWKSENRVLYSKIEFPAPASI